MIGRIAGLLLTGLCALASTFQAVATGGLTYTCKGDNGREIRTDRPPPECTNREVRVLNGDGSLREVVPPVMTPEEREADEARKRRVEEERVKAREAVVRDRLLLSRYPNQAAHDKARSEELDNSQKLIAQSEKRLAELARERKPLSDEAEFYVGRQMPFKLKQALDGNDAAVAAQRALIANQESETARINARFDIELARLRRLWAGAAPGSMGPLDTSSSASPGPVRKVGSR